MENIKVLLVDEDNGFCSQVAEALLNYLGQGDFEAISAGFEAGPISALARKVLGEIGLTPPASTRKVFDLYLKGEIFSYVITLCDPKTAEKCPIFPGITRMTNWPFPDPEKENISEEEKLTLAREIRDRLKERLEGFCQSLKPGFQG
ncbi:MAG: arsenate reductase ArsC [Candidatus Aminicenantes bacterium]|jgi:arsenate reductase|nr:arsenate reductase ArsC [Candidatus Aminicenantes bacterium]